jgi:hypothetical protein
VLIGSEMNAVLDGRSGGLDDGTAAACANLGLDLHGDLLWLLK